MNVLINKIKRSTKANVSLGISHGFIDNFQVLISTVPLPTLNPDLWAYILLPGDKYQLATALTGTKRRKSHSDSLLPKIMHVAQESSPQRLPLVSQERHIRLITIREVEVDEVEMKPSLSISSND